MKKPEEKKEIDTTLLKAAANLYLNHVAENYHPDLEDRYKNKLFEIALETIFGKDVWDFVNSKIV